MGLGAHQTVFEIICETVFEIICETLFEIICETVFSVTQSPRKVKSGIFLTKTLQHSKIIVNKLVSYIKLCQKSIKTFL